MWLLTPMLLRVDQATRMIVLICRESFWLNSVIFKLIDALVEFVSYILFNCHLLSFYLALSVPSYGVLAGAVC